MAKTHATLYIANCSTLDQDFHFRVSDVPKLIIQRIPAGSQKALLSKEIKLSDIDKIIKQHAKYGLIDAKEIPRTTKFVGLCYSLDVPVSHDTLVTAITHNKDVLLDKAHLIRTVQAEALHAQVQDQADRLAGELGSQAPKLAGIEMQIEQEVKRGEDQGADRLEEVISVSKPGSPMAQKGAERARQAKSNRR